jgi:hypothetical protein
MHPRCQLFFACVFLFLLSACGGQASNTVGRSPASVGVVTTAMPTLIPPTNTTCPQAGAAQKAVLSSMAWGTHPALVTLDDQNQLHLYDITKQSQTIIEKIPQRDDIPQLSLESKPTMPQLAANGQWLLFLAPHDRQQELRIVRLDGKGMQTLYCSAEGASLFDLRWSLDYKMVAFSEYTSHGNAGTTGVIKLLDLTTGKIRVAVQARTEKRETENGTSEAIYVPRLLKWLDKTHLYVQGQGSTEGMRQNLYLLDIAKKLPQNLDALPKLAVGNEPFFDFTNSLDNNNLYVSHCTGEQGLPIVLQGPSHITVQPARSDTTTILMQTQMAVSSIRMVTPTTLLFVVNRGLYPTETDQKLVEHNGLWKMNIDGSGMTRLMQTGVDTTVDIVPNGEQSSTLFAISRYDARQQTLSFGTAGQNTITPLAQFTISSDRQGGQAIIGWTTVG